tara:strand:- start:6660 stop:6872 length:213 start_codon:yes stop_codon:yes gene_type:complete
MQLNEGITTQDLIAEGFDVREEEFEDHPHLFVASKREWQTNHRLMLRMAGFEYAYYRVKEGYIPGWAYKI